MKKEFLILYRTFFLLILLLSCFGAFAQNKTINGIVKDQSGEPLIGVTVKVKGTTIGTITDTSGSFNLSNLNSNTVLEFTYIGMKPKTVYIDERTSLVVVMESSTEELDDIVVIGYQTVKKADLTGAVSVFKPEKMKNTVVTGTVADALTSVPGLFVRSSGQPGAEGFVQIRGTATFGSSTPLYVIDGVALGTANRDFNFNDIESIQVLKDASAAAIYGSRAANGVIIITTKKGSEGKMEINVSAKNTIQWLPQYNLTNREEWIKLNDLAFENAGRAPANHFDANTDWQEEVFKTGIIQDYNVSFSGGNKNSAYFISTNYQDNSGTTIGTNSNRFTARINTSGSRNFTENIKFTIGENVIISNYFVDELNTNPIVDVYRMLPTIPVYDDTNRGGFGFGDGSRDVTFGSNPIARENLLKTQNENMRIRGNAFAEISFYETFKYKFNFGLVTSSDAYLHLQKDGAWTFNQPIDPTILNRNRAFYRSTVFDNTLEFNKELAAHKIAAVIGTSFSSNNYSQIWGTKNNVLMTGNDYFEQLDAALEDPKTGSFQNLSKLFSVFGRVNYEYNDRYLFSATIRRDESSKFGTDFRVGIFPSVAVGWKISNEDFFKVNWIDNLKLRANYGVLGSSNIGSWDYIPFINIYPQAIFGTTQQVNTGMTQVKLVNPDLKWEELYQMNLGFDANILRNRLEINGDFFIKTTRDVLTGMEILLSTGNNGGNPLVNAASLRNSGFEFSINWRDQINEFNYSINLNTSYIENEILNLGYNRKFFTQWNTKSYVGSPIGEWYLIKTDGLFRSTEEVLNHVNSEGKLIQPYAKPGDVRYIDYNDDGIITDADRQYCGSSFPSWSVSLGSTFEYKGFDMMFQFNSAFGHKLFNGPRSAYDRFDDNSNYRADYDAYNEQTNPNGVDPRPIYDDSRNVRGDQDRWLENGNYIRLKQLAIGYSLPKTLRGENLTKFRVFVNAQNLWTITKYKGLDPEFVNRNIWARGFDGGVFPNPYGITIGTQITF